MEAGQVASLQVGFQPSIPRSGDWGRLKPAVRL